MCAFASAFDQLGDNISTGMQSKNAHFWLVGTRPPHLKIRSHEIFANQFGDDHPLTYEAKLDLGIYHLWKRENRTALPLFESVSAGLNKHYGQLDSRTLKATLWLAWTNRRIGRINPAIQIFNKLMTLTENHAGKHDEIDALSRVLLASIYANQKDPVQAQVLLDDAQRFGNFTTGASSFSKVIYLFHKAYTESVMGQTEKYTGSYEDLLPIVRELQKAELVKLKLFAGLSTTEAGQAIGISTATAHRHWEYCRAWLKVDLG